MNKQNFFDAIRSYVNANGIEPRAHFVNNNLSVTVGEFYLAIEGRNHGNGYVTAKRNGVCIASELEIHATWNEDECVASALAIVQDKEQKLHEAEASTAETRAAEQSTATIDYYGCVQCQKNHFEGDDLYEPHLYFQSKHSVQRMNRADLARVRQGNGSGATGTRAEELSRVFSGHPPTRADVMSDEETEWLATLI